LGLAFNILALALLVAAGVAFTRQMRLPLAACGTLFAPAAAVASVATYWPLSPLAAVLLPGVVLGLCLLALLLYGLDRLFAVFCLEMTYVAMACWILGPLLVAVNFCGALIRWLGGAA
jgi:hypothetical protein